MKNIELYLWWNCGDLDGDGYESDYTVSDEDYNTIVNLIKKYAVENCTDDDLDINPHNFTEKYFRKNASELYDQIDACIKDELIATTVETAEDWFDEEEEECTIEEYLEDNYSFGFYFTEDFLASILEEK